jgi:hypothetical protein
MMRNIIRPDTIKDMQSIDGLWKYKDMLVHFYFEPNFDFNDGTFSIGKCVSMENIRVGSNTESRIVYEGVDYKILKNYRDLTSIRNMVFTSVLPRYDFTITLQKAHGFNAGHASICINQDITGSYDIKYTPETILNQMPLLNEW